MRERDPQAWQEAVTFDEALRRRGLPRITGEVYLHRSLQPLAQVALAPGDHGASACSPAWQQLLLLRAGRMSARGCAGSSSSAVSRRSGA